MRRAMPTAVVACHRGRDGIERGAVMRRVFALLGAAAFAWLVGVAPMAAEPTAVGAEKCAKMCHKVEYTSWLESKHAKAAEKTECEACHGNGSEYMKLSVMKDPAKAKAAGLIAKPDKASCTAKCHKPADIKDDMLAKVHAHKPKA